MANPALSIAKHARSISRSSHKLIQMKALSASKALMVSSKHISTCCVQYEKYRKVYEKKDGDTIELDASFLETDSRYSAVENPHGACPICSRNLRITYKDVLILSQFVDKDGTLLPRSLTGVCSKQQHVLQECVERALEAGLLPDHRPPKAVKEKGVAAFHRF